MNGLTIVFVGPTIEIKVASELLDASFRGPAKRGDIITAFRDGADRIAIIDGYLCDVPAVTHKEILWVMDQGVDVWGASSLGALRAAELSDFGMVGVGKIFEDYRLGNLTDDDEVAIQHGPEELNYVTTSVAMVNIRATLKVARLEGFRRETIETMIHVAKSRHYPERNWTNIVRDAMEAGVATQEIEQFTNWIQSCEIDQKLRDAEALLKCIAASEKSEQMQTDRSSDVCLTEHLVSLLHRNISE